MDQEQFIIELAAKLNSNWRSFPNFSWRDKPKDDSDLCIVYTLDRDAPILRTVNNAAIAKIMEPFCGIIDNGQDCQIENHSHSLCGWLSGYAIRVYKDGKITKAFREYAKVQYFLQEQCCLNIENYIQRCREATVENIERVAYSFSDEDSMPEDWVEQVYWWLLQNDKLEEAQETYVYTADDRYVKEAFLALGYKVKE